MIFVFGEPILCVKLNIQPIRFGMPASFGCISRIAIGSRGKPETSFLYGYQLCPARAHEQSAHDAQLAQYIVASAGFETHMGRTRPAR